MQIVALTEPQPICNVQTHSYLKFQETGTFPLLSRIAILLRVWTHEENNYKPN